jgi:WD40 repeat protein/serine/threonine protein kinase
MMNEREIYIGALHRSGLDRSLYLDQTCGASGEFRQRVESLLAETTDLDGFLESPPSFSMNPHYRPGDSIGSYQILQEIGGGGMGTVYLAQQTQPFQRNVAVKIVNTFVSSSQIIARFETERRALALMDHPNIARVLDGGTTPDGHPYFVMQFIDGVSITDYCTRHSLNSNERLELLVDVSRAVQHAHQKGIIHRDLKPSNILVSTIDGRPVPKVIDFGVAKVVDQNPSEWLTATHCGQIVGTLAYMSPEQATHGADIDTRTDVYSLGVLAYELLTGRTPMGNSLPRNASYADVLQAIDEVEPLRPSMVLAQDRLREREAGSPSTSTTILHRQLRDEVDWIVMKCLEKDRSRRYATVEALIRDVERYLAGDAVDARPPSKIYLIRKFVRRHSLGVFGLCTLILVLIVGITATTMQALRAMRAESMLRTEADKVRDERDRALNAERKAESEQQVAERARQQEVLQRQNADRLSDRSKRQSYAAQINLAFRAWKDGQVARSLVLLEGQRPRFDEEDLRTFSWYYLWQVCHQGHVASWQAERGQVTGIRFLNNDQCVITSGWEGVRIWDVDLEANSCQHRMRFGTGNTWALAVSPDQQTVASATTATDPISVYVWNVGKVSANLMRRESIAAVRAVAFSRDGRWMAAGGGRGVTVWSSESGFENQLLQRASSHAVTFSPFDDVLAAGTDDGHVHVWSITDGTFESRFVFPAHEDQVRSIAISPDGKLLASASRDVKIWDLHDGSSFSIPELGNSVVSSIDFSPDGQFLAIASEDRTARIWDVSARQVVNLFPHDLPLSAVRFSPSGQLVATATHDGSVHFWKRTRFASETTITHRDDVAHANILPGGRRILAMDRDSTHVWQLSENRESADLIDSWPGKDTRLSSDRRLIATLIDKSVEIRDPITLKTINRFRVQGTPSRIELAASGDLLAAWESDHSISVDLYRISTGAHVRRVDRLSVDFSGLTCLALNALGTRLATGHDFWWLAVRDAVSGEQQLLLTHDRSSIVGVSAVAFSANERFIVTGTTTGTIRIWDAADGQLRSTLTGHTGVIRCVAFSPDEGTLASASDDATARLWDVATGSERALLLDGAGAVNSIEFDSSGMMLVAGCSSGNIKVWTADQSRSAAAHRSELFADDPESAAGLSALAWQAERSNQRDRAIELYQLAQVRLQLLARRDPDQFAIREYWLENNNSLAGLRIQNEQFDQAQTLLLETIESERKSLGGYERFLGMSLALLGETYCRQREYRKANIVLKESLEIRHTLEPDTIGTHTAEFWLGLSLVGLGLSEEGEMKLNQARAGLLRRQHLSTRIPQLLERLDQFTYRLYESRNESTRAPQWSIPANESRRHDAENPE